MFPFASPARYMHIVPHLTVVMLQCFILDVLFLCILISPIMNTPAYMNKQVLLNITMETEFGQTTERKGEQSQVVECFTVIVSKSYFHIKVGITVRGEPLVFSVTTVCISLTFQKVALLRITMLLVPLPCSGGSINYHRAGGLILYPRRQHDTCCPHDT